MLAIISEPETFSAIAQIYGISTFDAYSVRHHDARNLKPEDFSAAIILDGEWLHDDAVKALISSGFKAENIATSTEFNRVHELLGPWVSPQTEQSIPFSCVKHDLVERQWFAYPLILSVIQAQKMQIKSITAIEFGVWYGNGLRSLANIGLFLQKTTGIEVRVVGFDTGAGLPSVDDWRDHPELWGTGDFPMPDVVRLRDSLPVNADLIIGDIADTLPMFIKNLDGTSPIGFVSLDVDTYSSSVSCLKLFSDAEATHLLPATIMYGDDCHSNIMYSQFAGEALAINEFNHMNELRKIDKKVVRTHNHQKPWHHVMYFVHVFDHPVRNKVGVDFGPIFHWKY